MNAGLIEIKGVAKKKKSGEEYWWIPAVEGAPYKHASGYYYEIGHKDANERFDEVAIVNKNTDGTRAHRGNMASASLQWANL